MSFSSFFSSLLPIVHNDAPKEEEEVKEEAQPEEEPQEEKEEEPAAEEAEEEEEEPEDVLPAIREECAQSAKCIAATKHFEHCQEKVNAGKGFHGEDCIEEFYHMMHCVDNCVAPRLFAKLK